MNLIYHHNLEPGIFKLGFIEPRWYALMYIMGFIATYYIISNNKDFLARGLTKDDAMDFLTYGFFGVILGGRLGYVLFYGWHADKVTGQMVNSYFQNPLEIAAIWHGGMSFHGGLIGSILAAILYARAKKIPMTLMCDLIALAGPLGLMFGRIGNFINGELWGRPTDGTWGVVFEKTGGGSMPRHPTQLYEGFFEGLLLFLVLWFVYKKFKNLKPGTLSGLFLMGYGLGRSVVEFYRIPDPQYGYLYGDWLTMGHVLSLPMILGGLGLFIAVQMRPVQEPPPAKEAHIAQPAEEPEAPPADAEPSKEG